MRIKRATCETKTSCMTTSHFYFFTQRLTLNSYLSSVLNPFKTDKGREKEKREDLFETIEKSEHNL